MHKRTRICDGEQVGCVVASLLSSVVCVVTRLQMMSNLLLNDGDKVKLKLRDMGQQKLTEVTFKPQTFSFSKVRDQKARCGKCFVSSGSWNFLWGFPSRILGLDPGDEIEFYCSSVRGYDSLSPLFVPRHVLYLLTADTLLADRRNNLSMSIVAMYM